MPSQTASKLEPRAIDPAELAIGKPLPGALRDFYGRILIAAGTVLTGEILARVAKAVGTARRVYVGPDWPDPQDDAASAPAPAATPSQKQRQILTGLLEAGLVQNWAEKRDAARHVWNAAITIAVEEVDRLSVVRRQVEIQVVDISLTGIGFTYEQFLHDGTAVYVQFDMLPRRPVLKGVVRYCYVLKGLTHRIGVAFVTDE